VALCQARISTKPLWGFSSSNPYHSQSRAEHSLLSKDILPKFARVYGVKVKRFLFTNKKFKYKRSKCGKNGRLKISQKKRAEVRM
jgi:hypothetical protein